MNGDGQTWIDHPIGSLPFRAARVIATNLDGDGDMDVLSAARYLNTITWYKNTAGGASAWLAQPVATNVDGAFSVFAKDMDADGYLDVVSASLDDDTIAWYPQLNIADPLDSDSDGDGICDGGNQVGDCTGVGPDNCPFVENPDQLNSDSLPPGDTCQCGDVTNDGTVDAADRTSYRSWLVGATGGGTFEATRCNVIGPRTATPACDVSDIFILDRFLQGQTVSVGTDCPAYQP